MTTFIGIFIVLTGLVAGVALITQPVLFEGRAIWTNYTQTPNPTPNLLACTAGLDCKEIIVDGAKACKLSNKTVYCCPSGQVASMGRCVVGPTPRLCERGVSCDQTYVDGASYCDALDIYLYCCPKNKVIRNGRCDIPLGTCNMPWINDSCGGGDCAANELHQTRNVPESCGPSARCLTGYDMCQ